ncbi:TIGR04222 domain-containing membrane protein [Iningainema sp. BLCCT55]|uniref:TIGR04222 domain-containing membrane protein n=2 Tax=Iningainema TaxID=1932705 RepID=A0A8J6XM00_9CYAN|nr:TIGR04222 domain-containing membrane protein [Iningainema tapete]MBD2775316.1 TIGR04222 domain-containing membrane protein [Iningainema tapete BLCC-T55]
MLGEQIPKLNQELPRYKLLISIVALSVLVAIAIPTASLIANMYGPNFLVLYGAVILITLAISGWLVQDPTKNQPLPLIPTTPDPYEIAYLQSQETGVVKVAVIDLIQRGYLEINEILIKQAKNHPNLDELTPLQREVFDWFSTSRTATEMVFLRSLTEHVQPHCSYQQQLQSEQLLNTDEFKARKSLTGLIGTLIILGLGSFKLLVALAKGRHNVGFLILMGIISLYLLWCICQPPPRLSSRGKLYLKQLEQTFAQLKQKVKTDLSSVLEYNLVVALFGVSALAGTPYDYHQKILSPVIKTTSSSSSSSGGCGSSCGGGSGCSSGSSCGGGGCGGGCGGCGGG